MLPTPIKMKKISLTMLDTDAQQAALTLAHLEVVHLLEDNDDKQLLSEFPVKPFYDVYHRLKSRFAKIKVFLDQELTASDQVSQIVSFDDLNQSDQALKEIWIEVSRLEEKLRRLKDKMNGQRHLAASLQKFATLDLDLSRLQHHSRFLKILVGTVPVLNFPQLERALSLVSFVMTPFYSAEGHQHVVIVGSTLKQQEVQEVLQSADFREINVPPEFSGSPAELQQDLSQQLELSQQKVDEIAAELKAFLNNNLEVIQTAFQRLFLASSYASLDQVLKGKGGLVSLQGWVPAQQQQKITAQLEQDLNFPFYVQYLEPQVEDYDSVPSLLKHSWLLKPFQGLVHSFGIPSYTEIDPTALFTISYILMFGMMFGDIGHGLVIVVASLFFWKSHPAVTIVALLAGLSSAFFGLVYGSLFGYEDVVDPLWMSPMHDPEKILLIAVVWGAAFIMIANLLAIRNALAVGQYHLAYYSGKGLAGLVFYLGLLFTAYSQINTGQSGWMAMSILILSMVVILYYQWQNSSGSASERLLVVVIEGLEHMISTVSSTLSFLRVAAFSLNHIALAAAVFSIAGMMDTTGHWITVVLGNIFIIVLEGAIVAIQCLRLEYYEGFSRFFSGKGKAFAPLKLET